MLPEDGSSGRPNLGDHHVGASQTAFYRAFGRYRQEARCSECQRTRYESQPVAQDKHDIPYIACESRVSRSSAWQLHVLKTSTQWDFLTKDSWDIRQQSNQSA